jgi:hydrogenase nickel incorporation protein HypA/HybF
MHEIGVLTKAIDLVEEIANSHDVERVEYVTLEIGELSGYLPVFFEKYFPVVIEDRPIFAGTELRMNIVKGEALCKECKALYNVMKNEGKCPCCGSREKEVLGGQQFIVKEIGY